MRKIITPIVFLFALSANATTITSDTNASSITDFSTATTTFDASSATDKTITLTVDATAGDVVGYNFDSSQANTTNKILINGTSEYGLKVNVSTKSFYLFTGKDTSTVFEVNGTGPFKVNNSQEVFFAKNASLTFNVDFSVKGFSGMTGNINFYGKSSVFEQYSGQNNHIVTFGDGENASTSTLSQLAMWGSNSKATISKYHTMTMNNGLRSASTGSLTDYNQTLIVNGIVNVNRRTLSTSGATNTSGTAVSRYFGLLLNDVTIGAGGEINQKDGTNVLVNSIKGDFVNSGTLKTAQDVYFSTGATITLNKDSGLQIAGATTTKTSYLSIANIVVTQTELTGNPNLASNYKNRPVAAYITDSCVSGADVTFNVVSDTDIGGFNIYKDSVLTLDFAKDTSLKVEAFKFIDVEGSTVSYTTDFSEGDFAIKVVGDTNNESLFVSGMTAEQIDNIKWLDKDGKDLEYSLRTVDGGIYVVVPEPAEWAMIFGILALAFVAYRRRK